MGIMLQPFCVLILLVKIFAETKYEYIGNKNDLPKLNQISSPNSQVPTPG